MHRTIKTSRLAALIFSSFIAANCDAQTISSNAPNASAYSPKHFDVQMQADLKSPQAVSQAMADAKQELASINDELDKAAQEQTDLETKLASGKRKIAALQSQQTELKKESGELDDKIKNLQSQEVYVFQSAGAILDAQDFSGALQAYKDFVSKFPQTARVSKANEIIASLEQKLGVNKQ